MADFGNLSEAIAHMVRYMRVSTLSSMHARAPAHRRPCCICLKLWKNKDLLKENEIHLIITRLYTKTVHVHGLCRASQVYTSRLEKHVISQHIQTWLDVLKYFYFSIHVLPFCYYIKVHMVQMLCIIHYCIQNRESSYLSRCKHRTCTCAVWRGSIARKLFKVYAIYHSSR